jgi:hypothetical protein
VQLLLGYFAEDLSRLLQHAMRLVTCLDRAPSCAHRMSPSAHAKDPPSPHHSVPSSYIGSLSDEDLLDITEALTASVADDFRDPPMLSSRGLAIIAALSDAVQPAESGGQSTAGAPHGVQAQPDTLQWQAALQSAVGILNNCWGVIATFLDAIVRRKQTIAAAAIHADV